MMVYTSFQSASTRPTTHMLLTPLGKIIATKKKSYVSRSPIQNSICTRLIVVYHILKSSLLSEYPPLQKCHF